ncbi:hypothetical protein [Micromonospora sp. NPDC047730]|uniref:hypothetical protein n=1 Tax=Micromonospora sp. NPDC047730 TaxID=3364253 RepID=UPI00372263BA
MTTTTAVRHWHVATGLVGYGPDGADGYGTAIELTDVADLIRDELRQAADSEDEGSRSEAEAADFSEAWKLKTRAEHLSILAETFSNDRANAPLYAGKPEMWADTIETLIRQHFPLDISDRSRLYVWPCAEPGCEHLADLER